MMASTFLEIGLICFVLAVVVEYWDRHNNRGE